LNKRTLTSAVLITLTILMMVSVPVYAKPKTKTGTLTTVTVNSGNGEEVALFREGKMIWQEAIDVVPTEYYEQFGTPAWIPIGDAFWITYDYEVSAPSDNSWYIYTKTFDIPGEVVSASISITADNAYMLHVNGRLVGRDGNLFTPIDDVGPMNWQTPETYDVTKPLREGSNNIVVYVRNYAGMYETWQENPTGLIFSITITYLE
jgi:hypothetical protein